MNYKYWSQFLSQEEFELWEVEVLMYIVFRRGDNIFEGDYPTWKDFINASFEWTGTKQGSQYWIDIFRRDNY